MTHPGLLKIFELADKFDRLPETEEFLKSITDDDLIPYLPMCNVLNEHTDAPNSIKEILSELSEAIHGALIDKTGQSSSLFYEIKNHGWLSRVAELDSFGPLSCVLGPPHRKWMVAYG